MCKMLGWGCKSCWYEENVTFQNALFLPSPSLWSQISHAWPAAFDMYPWWSERVSASYSAQPARLECKSASILVTVSWRGEEKTERQREENWFLIRLDWMTEVLISNKGGGLTASSMSTHTESSGESWLINTTYNLHILQLVCQGEAQQMNILKEPSPTSIFPLFPALCVAPHPAAEGLRLRLWHRPQASQLHSLWKILSSQLLSRNFSKLMFGLHYDLKSWVLGISYLDVCFTNQSITWLKYEASLLPSYRPT